MGAVKYAAAAVIAGAFLVTVGVLMLSIPAGFIVLGCIVAAAGLFIDLEDGT